MCVLNACRAHVMRVLRTRDRVLRAFFVRATRGLRACCVPAAFSLRACCVPGAYAHVRESVRTCENACVRACMRAYVHVHVCICYAHACKHATCVREGTCVLRVAHAIRAGCM